MSTVLVAGSSGAFFFTADTVVQMERYEAHDITERVRAACSEWASPLGSGTPPFKLPEARRTIGKVVPMRGGTMSDERGAVGSGGGQGADRSEVGSDRGMSAERGPGGRDGGARGAGGRRGAHDGRRGAQGGGRGARGRGMRGGAERHGRDDRVKVKLLGRDGMRVGDGSADLRLVEQLVDAEQTAALAQMVRLAQEKGLLAGSLSPQEAVARLFDMVRQRGLGRARRPWLPDVRPCHAPPAGAVRSLQSLASRVRRDGGHQLVFEPEAPPPCAKHESPYNGRITNRVPVFGRRARARRPLRGEHP